MYDLGDTIPLAARCVDAAGTAANATTVVLTVTKPDGTDDTPTVTNPPATTGQYAHEYVPTQAGRHTVRWTFTGAAPDQAYADVFNVWPAAPPWIVGMAEAKDFLNIPQDTTAHDEELRRAIAGCSAVVEDIVGVVAVRSFTGTFNGGRPVIQLSALPVVAVTSVTADGALLDDTGYACGETGLLTRKGGDDARWPDGARNITAVWRAGRPVVPDNILEGTRDLIRVNFRPQLGGNYGPFDRTGGNAQPRPGDSGQGQMRLGFFVPNSVMQRLTGQAVETNVR